MMWDKRTLCPKLNLGMSIGGGLACMGLINEEYFKMNREGGIVPKQTDGRPLITPPPPPKIGAA